MVAKTVAEARAQTFVLPEFKHWCRFAGVLDGYTIAAELGFDLRVWGRAQAEHWTKTGEWPLDVLELRLMLFFTFRADYWTGYDYTEHDEQADSLLHALSLKTGQPYQGRPLR